MLILTVVALSLPQVLPTRMTDPVEFDADDPAFMFNREEPVKSLILGTDKEKSPGGGLYAFGLDGRMIAKVKGLDRPNNVDSVEDFSTPNGSIQLAVVTERLQNRLRVFAVSFSGETFRDVTGQTEVFKGESGEDKAPMGIACWQKNGRTFAFVTPKAGQTSRHVEQLELKFNSVTQKVDAQSVRRFGAYSGKKETESIVVDPRTERVFYSDEGVGVWAYDANPNGKDSAVGLIRNPEHQGDHEGLAIMGDTLISTDQRKDESVFWFYNARSLVPCGGFRSPIDETDGIDIIDQKGGSRWMAAMNSKGRNFALLPLDSIWKATKPRLGSRVLQRPTGSGDLNGSVSWQFDTTPWNFLLLSSVKKR